MISVLNVRSIVRCRHEQLRGQRLDARREGRGAEDLAIGLKDLRRIALDAELAPRAVEQRRVAAEVLPEQSPGHAERVAGASRGEDAKVEHAIVAPNAGPE